MTGEDRKRKDRTGEDRIRKNMRGGQEKEG
jgi:hypothetical protein